MKHTLTYAHDQSGSFVMSDGLGVYILNTKRVTKEKFLGTSKHQVSEMSVKDLCAELAIPYEAFLSWSDNYNNTKVSNAARLQELESENAKLRSILEQMTIKNALSTRW